MSTDTTTPATENDAIPASSPSATDPLWVERTGPRTYRGFSGRGATVEMGPASAGAVFTPGELLKVALAGCAGMSSDVPLARRLGDDYKVTIRIEGAKNLEEDRYPELTEVIELDLSSLDDATRDRVLAVAERSIEQTCTVGRTLEAGVVVKREFVEPASAVDAGEATD